MDNQTKERSLEDWAAHLDLEPSDLRDIEALLDRPATFPELVLFSRSWSLPFFIRHSAYIQQSVPVDGKRIVFSGRHRYLQLDQNLYCSAAVAANSNLQNMHHQHIAALTAADTQRQLLVRAIKPEAYFSAFRFGNPERLSVKRMVEQAVLGQGTMLNNLGLPMLGGSVHSDDTYNQNLVVNGLSIGLTQQEKRWGKVLDPDKVRLVLISNVDIESDWRAGLNPDLPLRIVPDALSEKNIQRALLAITELPELIDVFSVGLDGLSNTLLEAAFFLNCGMDLSFSHFSDLELGDVLHHPSLSGALIFLPETAVNKVQEIAQRWDVPSLVLGRLSAEKNVQITNQHMSLVELPFSALDGAKRSQSLSTNQRRPGFIDKANKFSYKKTSHSKDYVKIGQRILQEAGATSNQWLWQQFDQSSQLDNLFANQLRDTSVLRLPGSNKVLLVANNGNPIYLRADPYNGVMVAITEAIRKIIITGGQPQAITLSLNLGDATDNVVNWQLHHTLKGVNEVCRRFNLPVLEADISFGNQQITKKGAYPILPTPVVTLLGTMYDNRETVGNGFLEDGHLIYMIGTPQNDVNSSLYLKVVHNNPVSMAPALDLDEEYHILQHFSKIISKDLISSAQAIGEGGLFVALIKAALVHGCGFDIETDPNFRKDTYLFGEHQSRMVVSVRPEREDELINYLNAQNVPFTMLGEVSGDHLVIDEENYGHLSDWKSIYHKKPFN